jgi:PHD/YefM family antitoxin component YafN of YafNO toxin-antitoxin module
MEFAKLKQLVRKNGDVFVLVDQDKPELVLMSFDAYERLAEQKSIHTIHPVQPEKHRDVSGTDKEVWMESGINDTIDTITQDHGDTDVEEFVADADSTTERTTQYTAHSGFQPASRRTSSMYDAMGHVRLEDIELENLPI